MEIDNLYDKGGKLNAKLANHPLIGPLLKGLYSKPAPSKILNDITFKTLLKLEGHYEVDHDALWLGSIMADLYISEARGCGKMQDHVPMAVESGIPFLNKNGINGLKQNIILEIIRTHHGGPQQYLESKLFKIADCHKFLEPLGLFDLAADLIKNEKSEFKEALGFVNAKLEEKFQLYQDVENLDKDFDLQRKYNSSKEFFRSMLDNC